MLPRILAGSKARIRSDLERTIFTTCSTIVPASPRPARCSSTERLRVWACQTFCSGKRRYGIRATINPILYNRRADRGDCNSSDQRHVFNPSGVLQTPAFSNRTLRVIASDWQFSPIVKIKAGLPFTASLGTDNALNGEGGGNQRPDLLPGVRLYAINKIVDAWLNRDAFAIPARGTLGNLGMNTLRGPGLFQLDLAVSRTFQSCVLRNSLRPFSRWGRPNVLEVSERVTDGGKGGGGSLW